MGEGQTDAWSFLCAKCGSESFYLDEVRGSSSGVLAFMNIDDQGLTLVVCKRCKYCDVYRQSKDDFIIRNKVPRELL